MFLINYLQIWIWGEASLGNFEWCNYTLKQKWILLSLMVPSKRRALEYKSCGMPAEAAQWSKITVLESISPKAHSLEHLILTITLWNQHSRQHYVQQTCAQTEYLQFAQGSKVRNTETKVIQTSFMVDYDFLR